MTKTRRQTLWHLTIFLVIALGVISGRTALADQHSQASGFGEVRDIEWQAGRLTIDHGPLLALNVPGATRVFSVRQPSLLEGLKVGDTVWFAVDKRADQLVISRIGTRPDEHGDH